MWKPRWYCRTKSYWRINLKIKRKAQGREFLVFVPLSHAAFCKTIPRGSLPFLILLLKCEICASISRCWWSSERTGLWRRSLSPGTQQWSKRFQFGMPSVFQHNSLAGDGPATFRPWKTGSENCYKKNSFLWNKIQLLEGNSMPWVQMFELIIKPEQIILIILWMQCSTNAELLFLQPEVCEFSGAHHRGCDNPGISAPYSYCCWEIHSSANMGDVNTQCSECQNPALTLLLSAARTKT